MPEVLDRYQQLLKDRHVGRRKGAASALMDGKTSRFNKFVERGG